MDVWSEEQFQDTLLAIHAYNKLQQKLTEAQKKFSELKQITRLKYYALRLFKVYLDQSLSVSKDNYQDLRGFGGKFNAFFERANTIIQLTLAESIEKF